MAATRVVMHQIVMPALTDSLGICFGGEVLSWIDLCAGMSAKTLARGPCVTATVDAVHFLQPCRLGSVVIIAAMVRVPILSCTRTFCIRIRRFSWSSWRVQLDSS